MQLAEQTIYNAQHVFVNNRIAAAHLNAPKTYEHEFFATLKQSNATQNIYFSNYIEWQGVMRERWFFECVDAQLLNHLGVFVTKQVHQDYIKEGFPFQTIACRLNTFNIKRCSFNMLFRFYIEGELTSSGYQQIAFTNHQKKISKLPDAVVEKIREYEYIGNIN